MDPATIALIASTFMQGVGLLNQGKGNGNEPSQIPTMTPEQEAILGQLTNMVQNQGGGANKAMGLLEKYMDPNSDIYKNFEAPYMQKFEQQTIPRLAEQFAGFGANSGALSSSGFGQALGAAGANLQTDLAAMKSGMQRNSINDYLGQFNTMTGQALNAQPFAYYQQQPGGGAMNAFGANAAGPLANYGLQNMNLSGQSNNGGYNAKYPLTNTYDELFRTGAIT